MSSKLIIFAIIDLVGEGNLGEEQKVLDEQNDKVLLLTERLQHLVGDTGAASLPKPATEPSQLLGIRLCRLENCLRSVNLTVGPLDLTWISASYGY